ncbi:MAG TPA: hypothetical protein DIT13_12400 [Verrucomicrobiales bacterium]|nr:hypothetical protein [Verrucomicrobiales bacterium]HRJ09580.1 hypothetical protein [Prosthecobacter sp.]HRK13816.1 hypothetical protein [Prosthecobacter sp.]
MMNEFENIQSLIRLKRHETPPEDFVEDFLARFKERQRAELLRQSARGLLWERISTFMDDMFSPRWTTAAATAAVAVIAAWGALSLVNGGGGGHAELAIAPLPEVIPLQPVLAVESDLIKAEPAARTLEIQAIQLSFNGEVLAFEAPADRLSELAGLGTASFPVASEILPVSFGN